MQGTEGKADPELMLRLARNGCSDGIAVFRYGDRQRYFCRARSIRSVPLRLRRLRHPGESADFSSARPMRWVRRWRPGQGRIWARRSRSESVKDFGWQIFTESYALHSYPGGCPGKYGAFVCGRDRPGAGESRIQQMLLINSGSYTFLILVNNVRFLIQGIRFSTLAIFSGVSEMIARGIAGFVLVPMFGFLGACVANPLAWLFADLFLIPAYLYVMRRVEDFFAGKRSSCKRFGDTGTKIRKPPGSKLHRISDFFALASQVHISDIFSATLRIDE